MKKEEINNLHAISTIKGKDGFNKVQQINNDTLGIERKITTAELIWSRYIFGSSRLESRIK